MVNQPISIFRIKIKTGNSRIPQVISDIESGGWKMKMRGAFHGEIYPYSSHSHPATSVATPGYVLGC